MMFLSCSQRKYYMWQLRPSQVIAPRFWSELKFADQLQGAFLEEALSLVTHPKKADLDI
jgi:hypothetical protein